MKSPFKFLKNIDGIMVIHPSEKYVSSLWLEPRFRDWDDWVWLMSPTRKRDSIVKVTNCSYKNKLYFHDGGGGGNVMMNDGVSDDVLCPDMIVVVMVVFYASAWWRWWWRIDGGFGNIGSDGYSSNCDSVIV